jgi:rhodanese-related sulfurtransferase
MKCIAVKALLDGDPSTRPLLLDVRRPDEHAICALPGALLVPLGELQERLDELDEHKHKVIVVYCHHGVRSLSGAAFLAQHGFAATSMRGGIEAWSREIDPTVPTY